MSVCLPHAASIPIYWNRAWPVRLPLPIIPGINASAHLFGGFGLKNIAMVPPECDGQVASTGFCVLNPSDKIHPRFVFYHVLSDTFVSLLNPLQRGTSYPAVRDDDVFGQQLRLPPLPEQRRIVAEIEKQFTRLDASVAALRRTQANLKRYRASVLRAACSGELVPTEAELACAEGRDYEPADVLLERILAERRARWEAQEKRRGKYKEPAAPDTSDLPPLPEGWMWATLGQIAALKGGVTKGQRHKEGQSLVEVPYLRVANVQRGYLDLTDIKTISVQPSKVDELRLIKGDILFNEGGDRDKLGRGWIWNEEIPDCIHQNHVFRVRLTTDANLPAMISWWGTRLAKTISKERGNKLPTLRP